MTYAIATHHQAAQPIISVRGTCRPSDMPAFIGGAFDRLFGRLGRSGIEPSGPPFAIYHAIGAEGMDAEVCVPVAAVLPEADGVVSRVVPAMTVACTLHVGPYERLETAYQAVTQWVDEHGFAAAGPILERYLNGPGDTTTPSEYRTEIELPVVPVATAVPA